MTKTQKKTIKEEIKVLSLVKDELYRWLQEGTLLSLTKNMIDDLTIKDIQRMPLLDQQGGDGELACFIVFNSMEVLIPYDKLPNAQEECNKAVKWLVGEITRNL